MVTPTSYSRKPYLYPYFTIGLIGARVVVEGVEAVQAHAPHGAPVELPKVDDEVGRGALTAPYSSCGR
jgi:hypothetical protein